VTPTSFKKLRVQPTLRVIAVGSAGRFTMENIFGLAARVSLHRPPLDVPNLSALEE
jgi:hypothetical protein